MGARRSFVRTRVIGAGSAVLVLIGVLSGCATAGGGTAGTGSPAPEPTASSPSPSPSSSLPGTPTTAPTASAGTPTTGTPTSPPTSSDGLRAASGTDGYVWPQPTYDPSGDLGAGNPCRFDVLDVSLLHRPHDSGAGSFYADVVFLNYSDVECTLHGYPTVEFVADAGRAIGAAAETPASAPSLLLSPGGTATSRLHFTQAGAYGCALGTATGLRVRAPGQDAATFLPYTVETCTDDTRTLTVSPVVAPTS